VKKKVIIISRCIRHILKAESYHQYYFHFKGYCYSYKIDQVILYTDCDKLKILNDYIIFIDVLGFRKNSLYGNIIYSKSINEVSIF
jgi:hypothetical protein